MYQVEIEQFNGPYDLLLQLIEKQDLAITDVALADITEQFLSYLDNYEEHEIDSDELTSFLVVASKLLYLKSKALLPAIEDDEDSDDLEKHLKIYKTFLDASIELQQHLQEGRFSFAKLKTPITIKKEFRAPEGCTLGLMEKLFQDAIFRLRPVVRLPKALLERTVSLHERVSQMRRLLAGQRNMNFAQIIKISENKLDVIISFLALLELVNQKKVTFSQEKHFDDIVIEHL